MVDGVVGCVGGFVVGGRVRVGGCRARRGGVLRCSR